MRCRYLLVVGLVLAGCERLASSSLLAPPEQSLPQRDVAALFQTDSLRYTIRQTSMTLETEIGFVLTNATSAPVYIVNCRGATELRLEKLVVDRWTAVWHPIIPACLSPPITTMPGGTYTNTIRVAGGLPSNNLYPKFETHELEGLYRIVWADVLRTYQDSLPSFGEPLPLEQRVSNRFWLEHRR